MLPGRLRECLGVLRWGEAELADALGADPAEPRTWLDGRSYPPLAVAAWLEALVKAHQTLPAPRLESKDGRCQPPLRRPRQFPESRASIPGAE